MRAAVVLVATALGALFAVGSVIAVLFELQGFGTPRDTESRLGYLLALAAAFGVSVALPVVLWRRLLPLTAPTWAIMAVPAVTAVLLLLGISALR